MSAVPLYVVIANVRLEPPPLADQLEETTPRVMITRVRLQVLGEVLDALP